MKFIDEALITVTAGSGGRGCVSFRREKYIPRGGPDGGDGGDGGDVIVRTTMRRRTLYSFRFKRIFKAPDGGHGQGRQKTGRKGEDLVIDVPPGTVITNAETGELVCDCVNDSQTHVIAKGGMGGRGNKRFATSTNRAPRYAQPGTPGEIFTLKLELKLLADVGIIGFPNAGKSTLLTHISSARPKIADYPFTTLSPVLGVIQRGRGEPFVAADIPGLIEGAHTGAGLGVRFLRHVERTGVLLHVIDGSSIDPEAPLELYHTINRELAGFSPQLAQKPQIIAINKMDLPEAVRLATRFEKAAGNIEIHRISAATGTGISGLLDALENRINKEKDHEQ
ncbi:MAG: GTPase ObgE [Desulfosalsimonadaceae bacterium]